MRPQLEMHAALRYSWPMDMTQPWTTSDVAPSCLNNVGRCPHLHRPYYYFECDRILLISG